MFSSNGKTHYVSKIAHIIGEPYLYCPQKPKAAPLTLCAPCVSPCPTVICGRSSYCNFFMRVIVVFYRIQGRCCEKWQCDRSIDRTDLASPLHFAQVRPGVNAGVGPRHRSDSASGCVGLRSCGIICPSFMTTIKLRFNKSAMFRLYKATTEATLLASSSTPEHQAY